MYRNGANEELSRAELEAARLGFLGYLRRKRFSPQFIARHAEDLFAQAALEYSRKLAEGVAIDNPPGWLIECAWRRTKSQLEAEKSGPRVVSTEKSGPLAEGPGHGPEDLLLDKDRFRKLREAVGELSDDQRRLLAASYFEGFTVRKAARRLRWHPSKAQRAHEGAKRRLHKLLGVDSLDELQIEIGLAAYLSIAAEASGLQVRAGVEAMVELAGRGAMDLWARAQDLARRFPFGGSAEPSTTAVLGGTAGRAAGICATAAVACIAAAGVVGPGVGGLIGDGGGPRPPSKARDVATAPPAPPLSSTPSVTLPPSQEPEGASSAGRKRSSTGATPTTEQRARRATRAVRSQSVESAAAPPPEEVASAPVESAPAAGTPTSSSSGSGSTSPSPTQVANEQFGP
jgi:DNA-directed RNA polymerase specialized sigma24 family protein